MIVLAAAIGFGVGYFSTPTANPPVSQRQFFFAGISCQEVRELLPVVMKDQLDATKAAQVREHVMQCPECRRLMEQMRASGSIGATLTGSSSNLPSLSLVVRSAPDREL
ncbi:MAG: zf-HC2 domain-containing protein [Planctomycetia bacterium]|nr:zf-HC2 domain-containing protein [Planctomycetia bacterium]